MPLTSIIFSPIHLIIHIHGKFLKEPVAELEAERGDPGFVRMLCDVGRLMTRYPAILELRGG